MPSMRLWLFTHLSSRHQQWTSGSTRYVATNHHTAVLNAGQDQRGRCSVCIKQQLVAHNISTGEC